MLLTIHNVIITYLAAKHIRINLQSQWCLHHMVCIRIDTSNTTLKKLMFKQSLMYKSTVQMISHIVDENL